MHFSYSPIVGDHVEDKKHPGQVHGLNLYAEPESDDVVLIDLTPYIDHAEDHRQHQ